MSDTIRVAMIMQSYYPRIGGAERQVAALAPLLREQGVDVQVVTRRYPGMARFERIYGVPVHRLPIPGPKPVASMTFTMTALPLLRRLRPDVLHAHELFSPATTAVAAKRLFGTPVVSTAHRSGALGDVQRLINKTFGRRRMATFREHVDAFVTISREIDAELAEMGVPPHRRIAIPTGVDTQRFAPVSKDGRRHIRERFGLPADARIAIFAGRLAPEKRLDRLIEIWPAVRATCPDALLLVVGAGPEEPVLRRTAGQGVWFAGATEDVVAYLQASDVFVLPSDAEGLSLAMLEALSTGLAVVATAVGGAGDVIAHGANGLLIPPGQPDELKATIVTLMRDSALRARLGDKGRARVVREFALPVMADRLRALYDSVITRQPMHIAPRANAPNQPLQREWGG